MNCYRRVRKNLDRCEILSARVRSCNMNDRCSAFRFDILICLDGGTQHSRPLYDSWLYVQSYIHTNAENVVVFVGSYWHKYIYIVILLERSASNRVSNTRDPEFPLFRCIDYSLLDDACQPRLLCSRLLFACCTTDKLVTRRAGELYHVI